MLVGCRGRGLRGLPLLAGAPRRRLHVGARLGDPAHRPLRLHDRRRHGPDRDVLRRRDERGPRDRAGPDRRAGRRARPGGHRRQRPRGDAAPHPTSAAPAGMPFAADPSQQLAFADGETIRQLIDGATTCFTNEYEAALTEKKTGWSAEEIAERVHDAGHHQGQGRRRRRATKGEAPIEVTAAREVRKADPTGVGDAFRAGFLTGLAWGLDHAPVPPRSARCWRPTSSRRSAPRSTSWAARASCTAWPRRTARSRPPRSSRTSPAPRPLDPT